MPIHILLCFYFDDITEIVTSDIFRFYQFYKTRFAQTHDIRSNASKLAADKPAKQDGP